MKEIADICKRYNIKNYTINSDGIVDVDGNVDFCYGYLTKLPLKFGNVSGIFSCQFNQLNTLEGCPQSVGGNFHCSYNKLTTLEGCPQSVGGNFSCGHNELTTLEFCPQSVGNFHCNNNLLTTLEGGPQSVGGDFSCGYNELTSLKGSPQSVGGYFDCQYNNLTTLEGIKVCPKSISFFGNPLPEYEINNPRQAILQNIREINLKKLGL